MSELFLSLYCLPHLRLLHNCLCLSSSRALGPGSLIIILSTLTTTSTGNSKNHFRERHRLKAAASLLSQSLLSGRHLSSTNSPGKRKRHGTHSLSFGIPHQPAFPEAPNPPDQFSLSPPQPTVAHRPHRTGSQWGHSRQDIPSSSHLYSPSQIHQTGSHILGPKKRHNHPTLKRDTSLS